MTTLFPIRKPCPLCGKPMKLVPGEIGKAGERYVCTDQVAREWGRELTEAAAEVGA